VPQDDWESSARVTARSRPSALVSGHWIEPAQGS